MRVVACVQVFLDVRKEQAERLSALADLAMYRSTRVFKDAGIEIFTSSHGVRNMSKEESMSVVPKKVHFATSGSTSCGLASKVTQKNWDLVTCKVCQKRRKFEAQQELPL